MVPTPGRATISLIFIHASSDNSNGERCLGISAEFFEFPPSNEAGGDKFLESNGDKVPPFAEFGDVLMSGDRLPDPEIPELELISSLLMSVGEEVISV